jgi:uncharacterized protein YkwD
MKGLAIGKFGCITLLVWEMAAHSAWADPVSAVQLMRVSGCAGTQPAIAPFQHQPQLDMAAARWALGGSPLTATQRSGYPARMAAGVRLRGPDDSILQALRHRSCNPIADPALRDMGVFRSGPVTWVVLAEPRTGTAPIGVAPITTAPQPPPITAAPEPQSESPPRTFAYGTAPAPNHASLSATRVLQLVNEVRARGTQCGDKSFGAAPPLQLSGTLHEVAFEHAADMARHDYFEHVDLAGHSPADRVRASGYREKLVGENIAYGPESADEVVAGWLHSSGHCENIMDPRFSEMGLASAAGQGSRRGLYWDQVLAAPLN